MEIIQITDLHITKNVANTKNACKPYLTLSKTLKHIKEHYPQVKDLVITGDLSNDYSKESYEAIKELLKIYEFNIFILPGNHDCLEHIQAICDSQISTDSIDLRSFNIVAFNFDTHVPGKINGRLKKVEINEFNEKLNNNSHIDKIIIFTHHPVTRINSRWIDKHICENSDELIELMLSQNNKEFKIFSGHVHQEFYYRKNNIEFFTTPSTCYQFKKKSEDFSLEDNVSYGYRVITLHDNNIKTKVVRV
mgnify:CR=1 FL=1|tara:strand:+ start:26 stop:772 length:747 start_codon:yes stop_codon:yes gene_type:complete